MSESAEPTERQQSIKDGDEVIVILDDASAVQTNARTDPWKNDSGHWVIMLEGRSAWYCLSRVHPICPKEEAA